MSEHLAKAKAALEEAKGTMHLKTQEHLVAIAQAQALVSIAESLERQRDR